MARPVAARAYVIQARAKWNLEEPLQAAALFAQAGQARGWPGAYHSAARAALAVPLEEYDARGHASEWLEQAIVLLMETGQTEQAEVLRQERAALPSLKVEDTVCAAEHFLATGKFENADALARTMLLREPENVTALRLRARAQSALEQVVSAAVYAHAAKRAEAASAHRL